HTQEATIAEPPCGVLTAVVLVQCSREAWPEGVRHRVVGVPVVLGNDLECTTVTHERSDTVSVGVIPLGIRIDEERYACLSLEEGRDVEILVSCRHTETVVDLRHRRVADMHLVVIVDATVAV